MQYVSESRWLVRTGNRTVQVSFPNCKAEVCSRPRRYRLLVSATVILLGLSDLMRCGIYYEYHEKGWYREINLLPLEVIQGGKRFFILSKKR